MDKLVSDIAANEVSKAVQEVLRDYIIDDWQSEPHHQHQNFAENMYGKVKDKVNHTMDSCGCPPSCWLLCLMWVVFVLNHLANPSLGWRIPLEAMYGSTPDISIILLFSFWHPVYFKYEDNSFPSQSKERHGRIVGFAKNVGDALTFKVLDEQMHKILYCSTI